MVLTAEQLLHASAQPSRQPDFDPATFIVVVRSRPAFWTGLAMGQRVVKTQAVPCNDPISIMLHTHLPEPQQGAAAYFPERE